MNGKTSLVLIGLVLIASAGMAQVTVQLPDDRVITKLEPTPWGEDRIDAFGIAVKITRNGIQTFVAKVSANFPDGTLLVVRGHRTDGQEIDLGTIKMMLESGSLELKSSADSSPAFPLTKLEAVTVYYRLGVLLKGKFER